MEPIVWSVHYGATAVGKLLRRCPAEHLAPAPDDVCEPTAMVTDQPGAAVGEVHELVEWLA